MRLAEAGDGRLLAVADMAWRPLCSEALRVGFHSGLLDRSRVEIRHPQGLAHDPARREEPQEARSQEWAASQPDEPRYRLGNRSTGHEDQTPEAWLRFLEEVVGGQQGDPSTDGMADDGDVPQVELEDEPVNQLGLILKPVLMVQRLRGSAEALHLDQHDAVILREGGEPSVPGVAVGPEAVDQYEGEPTAAVLLPVKREANGLGPGGASPSPAGEILHRRFRPWPRPS